MDTGKLGTRDIGIDRYCAIRERLFVYGYKYTESYACDVIRAGDL